MPRIKQGPSKEIKLRHFGLVEELAQELRGCREFGQPRIEETEFSTGLIRSTVIWDKWEGVPDEERYEIILRAYEAVEGKAYRDRVTLAIGLTFPEAHEIGHLPYRVEPLVRRTDRVSLEQCYQVMRDLDASTLFDTRKPTLRFATEEEAEAARKKLAELLPGGEEVWVIGKDFAPVPVDL